VVQWQQHVPLTVCSQIDAQLAVRHVEAIERTKSTKSSTFFGSSREAKDTNENDPAQEHGEETLVSSSAAGEPPRKRSKTAAADVDVMEKVGYISVLSSHATQ
jgi:hypothetical protein